MTEEVPCLKRFPLAETVEKKGLPMDEIVFRDMTTEDTEIVKALINSLYSEDAPGGSNENRAEITIYGIMDKPSRGRIIMMEWYGKIVGYGIVVFCWNVEFCGEIVNIEDIYVEPSYRSLGISIVFYGISYLTIRSLSEIV